MGVLLILNWDKVRPLKIETIQRSESGLKNGQELKSPGQKRGHELRHATV